MKFVSIRIHNLFSYRDGYFEFPLDSDPAHNVVLIHGRNGFGKTSFINSMKLLFLGLHPELTHNVRPPHKLRPEEYLLGSGAPCAKTKRIAALPSAGRKRTAW
jgi:DNA sulfur modification protein DndD